MRANGNFLCTATDPRKPFFRNAKLRRRTTPKQIGRRSGNHEKVWVISFNQRLRFLQRKISHLGVDQQRVMPGLTNLVKGEEQFQWVMRFLATKIDGARKIPI